jgi:DNA-binding CsgD family transcriptional regulator
MERQVVELVRQGLTNAEVAERLFTSPETVKTLLSRAFTKLGVRTRREVRGRPRPDA